jgi:hypothetical protein
MTFFEPSPPVRIGRGPHGLLTYFVDLPPEELPAVRGRDVDLAWNAAREAAISSIWGAPRGFRFRRRDGSFTDLALADRDASCWAAAVDGTVGLATSYGISLCLRLLALVDLLARAPWTSSLFRLASDGAELDPALLRAAAVAPLNAEARFDEDLFRARLGPFTLGAPTPLQRLSSAPV